MKKYLCCFIFFIGVSNNSEGQMLPYKNSALPIEERVKDLLSRMTPEEKFWQMFMIPGEVSQSDSDKYAHGIFGFQVSARSGNGNAASKC